jgi:hypothetical protein
MAPLGKEYPSEFTTSLGGGSDTLEPKGNAVIEGTVVETAIIEGAEDDVEDIEMVVYPR